MRIIGLFSSATREKRQAAIALGLETGLFQQCPVCRDISERQSPESLLQATERLGESRIAARDPRVAVFQHNPSELRQMLRDLYRRTPFDCTCERQ